MRALVTNDDGVHSPGLHALAQVAAEEGLDVVVAAPHTERSGASASLTALEEGGRLIVHEVESAPGVAVTYGVEATPAFITMAALSGAFGDTPGLVLSGINLGPNTGYAILHSGTVGATLTASTHSCPGLAFSLAGHLPTEIDTGAAVARHVLRWVLDREVPPSLVLNVNIPDVPIGDLRGLRSARLAEFGAVQAHVGEIGKGYVTITFSHVDAEYEGDTDAGLLRERWATVTAMTAPCASEAHAIDGLTVESWAPARSKEQSVTRSRANVT